MIDTNKAAIVDHMRGVPNNMEKIMCITRTHDLNVVEDCALVVGGGVYPKLLVADDVYV